MFKNKKWIWTALITLLVVVILAAGGKAIYHLGFAKGVRSARAEGIEKSGTGELRGFEHPGQGKEKGKGQGRGQGRGLNRSGPSYGFGSRGAGGGFHPNRLSRHGGLTLRGGSFGSHRGAGSILPRALFAAALLGLLIFAVVKLFRREGWQLSFGSLHPAGSDNLGNSKDKAPAKKAKKAKSSSGK